MALTYDAILSKSKVLIARALRLRNEQQDEEFQFWAAVAMELLAKATLAKRHAALVADPSDLTSLLVACGQSNSTEYKTIVAKTVYDRAKHLIAHFDEPTWRFCMGLAKDRNGELHSALMPFAAKDRAHWQSKYWACSKLLLEAQALSLVDYLGAVEAEHAEKIIADASEALSAAVRGRIQRHAQRFTREHATANEIEETRKFARAAVTLRKTDAAYEAVECPACECTGLLSGDHSEDVVIDEEQPYEYSRNWLEDREGDFEPYLRWVREIYSAEEFRCVACGLHLYGVDDCSPPASQIPSRSRSRKRSISTNTATSDSDESAK